MTNLLNLIGEANFFVAGWVTYFRHAHALSELRGLDGWLRRKLRCVRLKQCKQPQGLRRFLTLSGVSPRHARELASSGRDGGVGPTRGKQGRPWPSPGSTNWA
jgi:RNA-directed DNA polymerase